MNMKGIHNFHLGSNSTIGKDSRFLCVSKFGGGIIILALTSEITFI